MPERFPFRCFWSCGGHGPGVTPGPFPNPEAKAWHGDGTAPGRVWESNAPPHPTVGTPSPVEPVGLPGRGSLFFVVGGPLPSGPRGLRRAPGGGGLVCVCVAFCLPFRCPARPHPPMARGCRRRVVPGGPGGVPSRGASTDPKPRHISNPSEVTFRASVVRPSRTRNTTKTHGFHEFHAVTPRDRPKTNRKILLYAQHEQVYSRRTRG